MDRVFEQVMPPKTGLAVIVRTGQHLRVVDLEGKQVVDMAVFNMKNLREKLSTSYSRTRYVPKRKGEYIPRDYLTEGDTLMSTICRPMMAIIKETPAVKGVHDVHNRMCNRYLYEAHGILQDGCHEIISTAVAPYGLLPEDIPDTMDLFMNYKHDCSQRRWVIGEPVSRAGDYIEFRAEMDCLIGLSNCPEDKLTLCNGGKCTAVKVEVYEGGTRAVSELDIYRRQNLGNRIGPGRKMALLVVDFTVGFNDPKLFGGGNIDAAVQRTVGLLQAFRAARLPIAFTRIVYAADGSDAGVFCLKAPSLRKLTEDAPDGQIVPELAPRPGELIVRKTQASAFFGTGLAGWLVSQGADTVAVSGCTTSGCVRASVVDATAYNFRPIVVRDCVGDRALAPHEANLFDMEQKYADAADRDEVVGLCNQR